MIIYDNITIDKTVKTFKYQYLRIINSPLLRSFIFCRDFIFFLLTADTDGILLTANRTYLF